MIMVQCGPGENDYLGISDKVVQSLSESEYEH